MEYSVNSYTMSEWEAFYRGIYIRLLLTRKTFFSNFFIYNFIGKIFIKGFIDKINTSNKKKLTRLILSVYPSMNITYHQKKTLFNFIDDFFNIINKIKLSMIKQWYLQ